MGVIFEACSTQWTRWHLGSCPTVPLFFIWENVIMLWLSILVSWLILVSLSLGWRVWSHPSMGGKGPSSGGWEYSTSGRQTDIIIPLDMGCTYPFNSPLFVWTCQPWPSSVSGHILLGFTIHQCQQALTSFPPPHVCVPSEVHGHIILPKVFTHLLWMLWWMSIAEVVISC